MHGSTETLLFTLLVVAVLVTVAAYPNHVIALLIALQLL